MDKSLDSTVKRGINPATGKAYRSKGGSDPRRMRWVADQGSVFTEEVVESKGEAGVPVFARISVAFNVGPELATHIVAVHNKTLA
ncbi:hypothetical protein [Noviherbaspirillum malthae]|uniref:hypothetical protein n=1 Tax=Noviherbaspirillum malthae TaxID=1260987 RepID=UPI00188FD48F|nr:hypothetical protein [Noviherbaspirillum malthae]